MHATGTSPSRSCSGCRHAQLQKLEQLCGKHLCLLFQSQFLILEVIQMIKTKINVSLLFKCQLLRIRGQSISPAPQGACLGFQTQATCAQTSWGSLADCHAVDKKVKRLPALPPSSRTLESSKTLDKNLLWSHRLSLAFPRSNLLKARAEAVRKQRPSRLGMRGLAPGSHRVLSLLHSSRSCTDPTLPPEGGTTARGQ